MKPFEVGFDGTFNIVIGDKKLQIALAKSNKPLESFQDIPNNNFLLPNTFMWHTENDPELLYRSMGGQLYKVNFEPYHEN